MNITMLVLNDFTHDARVHKEAKTLVTAGDDVQVLALHRSGLPEDELVNGYRVKRLTLASRRWRGGRLAPLVKYLEWMGHVAQATRLRPADVYHSHDGNTLLATYPAVRRDSALWVYDSHELETGRNFGGSHLAALYRRLWPLPERLFIRRVDAVISANRSYAARLVAIYGIPPPTVVMNCPEYVPPSQSAVLQTRLGPPLGRKVVLYQGAVLANRGIETCIRSLLYLGPDVDLVLIGDGPARGTLETLVAELGLSGRVHFLGYVSLADLLTYTAGADVGLSLIQNTCTSYYYTLPNKILEYLMAGVPVVVSDFPEMGRIVREYQVGETVGDPSSPREVAAAIGRILGDPQCYERMHLNALRAAESLNWENEQKKLTSLYNRLR